MTLDDAIKYCDEAAEEKENEGKLLCQSEAASSGCLTCTNNHRQIAEWLRDYKRLKEQMSCGDCISRQAVLDMLQMRISGKELYKAIYDLPSVPQKFEPVMERELCQDAVSREAVLNALYALCNTGETLKENPWRDNPHIDAIIDAIVTIPPVTLQSKTGHWIYDDIANNWRCDKCGETPKTKGYVGTDKFMAEHFKFCNHCGAKMEVEE